MLRVLLTRPEAQSLSLAASLMQVGIEPVVFPTIEIVAMPENEVLRQLTADLSIYDMAIFISPAAVHALKPWLKSGGRPLQCLAVGKDTADLVTQLGIGTVTYPKDNFNRTALLELPELQEINQKNVLLCRGANGNNELAAVLRQRGANVFEAIAYHRQMPTPTAFPDLNTIDLIQCTSGEAMHNLVQLLGSVVLSKKLLLSSERLSDLAKSLGFTQQPLLAKNAGDDALLHTLLTLIG